METIIKVAFALWIGAGVVVTVGFMAVGIFECAVEAWDHK